MISDLFGSGNGFLTKFGARRKNTIIQIGALAATFWGIFLFFCHVPAAKVWVRAVQQISRHHLAVVLIAALVVVVLVFVVTVAVSWA